MIHAVVTRAPLPSDEEARLEALADAEVLGPTPPAELQNLVDLASDLIGCNAFLTLIDKDTLHAGNVSAGPVLTLPRCDTICNHVIQQNITRVMIVNDLHTRPEFASCPAIKMGQRFYAGVPIHAPDITGRPRPLGALCVMDEQPRSLSGPAQASLLRLARIADALLAARSAAKRARDAARHHEAISVDLARRNRMLAQAERLTQVGSWRVALPDGALQWSPGVWEIYGLPPSGSPTLAQGLAAYAPDARERVEAHLSNTAATGEPFDFEEDFHPANGGVRRVRCVGEREEADGAVMGLIGVFQDVTDRRKLEAVLRHDAATDLLTGLPNRQGFQQSLKAAMARAQAGEPLALMMMDLDGFKSINDRHGHCAGDQVLQAIGARLLAEAPAGARAARLGGDEFAIIVEDADLCRDLPATIGRFEALLQVSVAAEPGTLSRGTAGIAPYSAECATIQAFMRSADASLYTRKRARIGAWQRGSPWIGERRRAHCDG